MRLRQTLESRLRFLKINHKQTRIVGNNSCVYGKHEPTYLHLVTANGKQQMRRNHGHVVTSAVCHFPFPVNASLKLSNTTCKVLCTVFTHSLVCIRNLTRSLRSLVQFRIHHHLVRKYRTRALSMKYSIFISSFTPPVEVSNRAACSPPPCSVSFLQSR